ncbi:fused MFS/spermidine synthase [Stenotrophomonas cyclobalanopsidis]|uniref:fused MFS/spermidine synthase n=1 Tax=Stenotrophomonas cyclobalanopsidis TaxID=2771362 RepID=UPI0034610149
MWLFVLSGFSGLIYQSIWTHYLGLFLGHSSYAQSLVLLLFMGGMACGAWLVSRRSELLSRPLLAYAAIELIIGLFGLVFDPAYGALTRWAYASIFPGLGSEGVNLVRWGLATALVLPQCVLLGATFPLMSAGFIRIKEQGEGEVLSGLYFSNSIGAAAGALVATYLLLPRIGLPGAMMTAGLLNFLIAISIYPLTKSELPAIAATQPNAQVSASRCSPRFVLIVAALTGASSFVYEITWVRMLSLALGTTIHAFELMLAAFIAGIAMGGLWLRSRADRLQSPLRTAGWVQVWMGLAALASMFVYAHSFEWVGWLMRVIVRGSEGYGLYNVASGIISLLVMFPAAFFAGMTLPLLTLGLLRQGHGERVIGQVYAFNTLGAIIGILLAVHVLLPGLGLKLALATAVAIDLMLGLLLLRRYSNEGFGARGEMAWAAGLCAASLSCALMFVHLDPLMLNSSVYRHGRPSLAEGSKVIYSKDGKTATVAVYEAPSHEDGAIARSIATNGKVDAGLTMEPSAPPSTDESTMVLLAALPLSLKAEFPHVGVIGFGSGMTTHTLLGSRNVGRVDTVEIEPAMVEAARHFGVKVARAYDDPRSNIVIDDAKAYFSASPAKYDLIVSEPSNPWMGGTASLFSEEFYSFVPAQLNVDGLFVQWLQLYEIDPQLVSSVITGMLANFSDVKAYLANDSDLILVASPTGSVPALGGRGFSSEPLRSDLARVGVKTLHDLQDSFVMDRRGLMAFTQQYPARANSDYFPLLQLKAPEARFRNAEVIDFGGVSVAPWPVAKFLGGYSRRPVSDKENGGGGLPLRVFAKNRAARELRVAIVEGRDNLTMDVTPTDALNAEALRSRAEACSLDKDPVGSADMIYSIAIETVPFMAAEDQVGLWKDPVWIKCPPKAPAVTDALALVAAASQDDHQSVLEIGQRMLRGPGGRDVLSSGVGSYYVLGSLYYAALATEQQELAKSLHSTYTPRLPAVIARHPTLQLLARLSGLKAPGGEEGGRLGTAQTEGVSLQSGTKL